MSNGLVPWQPVLEGRERDEALIVVRQILDAADPGDDPSLLTGSSGVVLLEAYAGRTGLLDNWEDALAARLEPAHRALAEEELDPWLANGVTGIAWATAHLERMGCVPRIRGRFTEIDRALEGFLRELPQGASPELLYGLTGLGVYALERLPHAAARRLLSLVAARLEATAEKEGEQYCWFTPPDRLSEWQRQQTPGGHYNLGLAHGVPGMVALLGAMVGQGVGGARARRLLAGSVAWLLDQQLPAESSTCFPLQVSSAGAARGGRSAWCYGDPGLATALLIAGAGAGEAGWRQRALDVMRKAARRAPAETGVVDAGLCHGSAGLALLYLRMHHATGDRELAEAARFWVRHTLGLRRPGEGLAGFLAQQEPDGMGNPQWAGEPGLLTGVAGIGLVLLAATTPIAPAWDRCLLMSSPNS